jgi:hypothetical protein
MNRSRFIQGLKGDIQLSEKERRRIIRKSLQKYSWKTKCTVAMEEFAELQQQVSKQVRGYGDRIGLLEEMADAYICLNFLESIFDIKPEDFQKAIDTITKAFEEFAAKLKEMADTLNKAFGLSVPEKEKKKSLSSPARYGMSLKKFRRESFIKQYSYRPIARKHLPYQRRNY